MNSTNFYVTADATDKAAAVAVVRDGNVITTISIQTAERSEDAVKLFKKILKYYAKQGARIMVETNK